MWHVDCMKTNIHEIGHSKAKVIVIDDFATEPQSIIELANSMRPFPKERDFYYPGVRRYFEENDKKAGEYVDLLISNCIPFFRDIYGANGLTLSSVGFSVVTTPPEELKLIQCHPHIDSYDPLDIAILHYLNPIPKGGTAFFRHKSSGFELIDEANHKSYISEFEAQTNGHNPKSFINGNNEFFEEIARFDNVFNRVLIYQGAILHSGIIEPDFPFSLNPPDWRLTTTCFVKLEK